MPPLVFEAVIGLNVRELRRVLLPVSLLATLGVGITVALIGVVVHLGIGLDWTSAFLLGAILSPTDPIAVRDAGQDAESACAPRCSPGG